MTETVKPVLGESDEVTTVWDPELVKALVAGAPLLGGTFGRQTGGQRLDHLPHPAAPVGLRYDQALVLETRHDRARGVAADARLACQGGFQQALVGAADLLRDVLAELPAGPVDLRRVARPGQGTTAAGVHGNGAHPSSRPAAVRR